MPTESARLSYAVSSAIDMIPDDEAADQLEAHCRWSLTEVMKKVKPSDCTASEVVALLAVLAPVHARILGAIAPLSGPVLTLIRDTPPDFGEQFLSGGEIQPN